MAIRTNIYINMIKSFIKAKSFKNFERKLVGIGVPLLSFSSVLKVFENADAIDKNLIASRKVAEEEIEKTGWDRLSQMFSYDKYGTHSPQLSLVIEGGTLSFFTGMLMGGFLQSKEAFFTFIDHNKATAFTHHLEAKRKLQDTVTLAFVKGGWRVGWRLCFFSSTLLLATTSICTYRGKSSLIEYLFAGAISGAVYKLKQGPKPMISGGVVGACLGAGIGTIIIGAMKLLDISLHDVFAMDAERIEEYNKEKIERMKLKKYPNFRTSETNNEIIEEKKDPNLNPSESNNEILEEKKDSKVNTSESNNVILDSKVNTSESNNEILEEKQQ